jgi:hypothetical protein
MTKNEQLIGKLRDLLETTALGQKLPSVEELQDSIPGGAGIGTVIRAVQQAQEMGLPIVTVRGPDGGYFHGFPEDRSSRVAAEDSADLGALILQAREIRTAVDELILGLQAAIAA